MRTIPICVNTVQHPLPTPRVACSSAKCSGRAIESWPEDERVVVLGTGGLSHQLDGQRAGFINKPFDLFCLEKIVHEPEGWRATPFATSSSWRERRDRAHPVAHDARRASAPRCASLQSNYHVPISNTGSGLLLLEKAA